MDGVTEFQHWGPAEPSGGKDNNCAVLNMNPDDDSKPPGFWSAEECNGPTTFHAICEEVDI